MDATDTAVPPPAHEPTDADAERTLFEVARDTSSYARAWSRLLASEAALARRRLAYIALGALLLPALAFGIVAAVDAALAALLFEFAHDWLLAIGIVGALNVVALLGLLWMLRSWWRTLSLPLSRQALTRLWRNDGDVFAPEHESTPAGSAV